METFSSKLEVKIWLIFGQSVDKLTSKSGKDPTEILPTWCQKWGSLNINFQSFPDWQFPNCFFHPICMWMRTTPSASGSAAPQINWWTQNLSRSHLDLKSPSKFHPWKRVFNRSIFDLKSTSISNYWNIVDNRSSFSTYNQRPVLGRFQVDSRSTSNSTSSQSRPILVHFISTPKLALKSSHVSCLKWI